MGEAAERAEDDDLATARGQRLNRIGGEGDFLREAGGFGNIGSLSKMRQPSKSFTGISVKC